MEFSQDASFPLGFKEAMSEALLFVCKDRLTFESLSLTGSLTVCLDQGKSSSLYIAESITKDKHLSPITSNLPASLIKSEVECQFFYECDALTRVKEEIIDDSPRQNNVLGHVVCEESNSCVCDDDIAGHVNIINHCEYFEPKIEKYDDSVNISIDVTCEQNETSCSGMSSDYHTVLSQADHKTACNESEGNVGYISNHFSQFVMILLLGQLTTYKQSVNIFGPLVTFAKLALAIYLFVYPSDAS